MTQGCFALDSPPALPPTNVRLFRGVLRWDTREGAEAHVRRCGNLYKISHRYCQVRPRETRAGVLLVAWDGGYPYVLAAGGEMRKMRASDVAKEERCTTGDL